MPLIYSTELVTIDFRSRRSRLDARFHTARRRQYIIIAVTKYTLSALLRMSYGVSRALSVKDKIVHIVNFMNTISWVYLY